MVIQLNAIPKATYIMQQKGGGLKGEKATIKTILTKISQ
jgi:hypothetical protein